MLPYLTRTTTVRPAEEPRLPRATTAHLFPAAQSTLPRISRISRTISVGPGHLTTHTTHITHHFRRPSFNYGAEETTELGS